MYDLKERKRKKNEAKKNLEYRDQKTNCCDQNDTHIGGKKKGKICITVWSSSDFFYVDWLDV